MRKVFAEIVAMLADWGLRVGQRTILDKLGIAEASEGEAVLGALACGRAERLAGAGPPLTAGDGGGP